MFLAGIQLHRGEGAAPTWFWLCVRGGLDQVSAARITINQQHTPDTTLEFSMSDCFSENYLQARERFVQFAQAARANLDGYQLSVKGPQDITLTTDFAWIGPETPEKILLVRISAPVRGSQILRVPTPFFPSQQPSATRVPAELKVTELQISGGGVCNVTDSFPVKAFQIFMVSLRVS